MAERIHAEIIKAWAADSSTEIEYSCNNGITWNPIAYPAWNVNYMYRIKEVPKPKIIRWKFAFKRLGNNGHWIESTNFYTEEEAKTSHNSAYTLIKLEYTKTEFPE